MEILHEIAVADTLTPQRRELLATVNRNADRDGTARLELAGLNYQTSLKLYADGRVSYDEVVEACRLLAVASRRRRLRHQAARQKAA